MEYEDVVEARGGCLRSLYLARFPKYIYRKSERARYRQPAGHAFPPPCRQCAAINHPAPRHCITPEYELTTSGSCGNKPPVETYYGYLITVRERNGKTSGDRQGKKSCKQKIAIAVARRIEEKGILSRKINLVLLFVAIIPKKSKEIKKSLD